MAHRRLLLGLLLLFPACGGHVIGEPPPAGTAGGTAGSSGTGGSSGAAGAATGAGGGQGGQDWTACGPGDSCALEPTSCCGPPCEPVAQSWFTAINSGSVTAYQKSLPICPCVASQCPPVPIGQANTPNYYATCEAGRCRVEDLRTSPLSACTADSDCYLRSGTTCCGCGNEGPVAASIKANVEAVFCPPGGCAADCAQTVPYGVRAICWGGHCTVHYDALDGGGAAPACPLLGPWHAHSPPWNNESTDAVITFYQDGTLSGVPAFQGQWSLVGTTLSIFNTFGPDMTCSATDLWTLTFSADCRTAPLLAIGSGCTGARRYLDWDVTLTRD